MLSPTGEIISSSLDSIIVSDCLDLSGGEKYQSSVLVAYACNDCEWQKITKKVEGKEAEIIHALY